MILKAGNAARVIATDLDDTRLARAAKLGAITVNAAKEDAGVTFTYPDKDECIEASYHFEIGMRLSKATELMRRTDSSIGDIAALCGYPNQLHFSRAFKKRYGVCPRQWRAENAHPVHSENS